MVFRCYINVTCPQNVGWSALFIAAKSGLLGIVQQLLRAGATVDVKDKVKKHNFVQENGANGLWSSGLEWYDSR